MSASEMNRELVLSKCSFFVDVHLWPLRKNLNPELWLSNFHDDEAEYAVHLLNNFLYFSDQLINQLFITAFQLLSNRLRRRKDSFLIAQASWGSFVDNLIITPVTGEIPNISDSGFSFARKARQQLGIREEQLLSQEDCLRALVDGGPRPVIFVDDFVGSGNQFIETWKRRIRVRESLSIDFREISSTHGTQFFYCPLFCTQYGFEIIQSQCPSVIINPAHILTEKYSALNKDYWPERLRDKSRDFLYVSSQRAGIPDNNGDVDDWRGFHKLGLSVAFGDSVPDATLPLFYWQLNGWNPLIKRT
jgi:hypothetical protein